ncbi:hypothetical protein HPP92_028719 [Vanilla planifolia]|uniref:Uncharacterized protein n=1 Tax=Vanilla planifolia TaxID=51239 RepID=A0A835U5B4_VANPL|nr:hypothetical protein HPP92_028719 [Vanilla planifolia]KAG0446711.1 hypothetical protein HPP92_028702 [Vanilla planifolia]
MPSFTEIRQGDQTAQEMAGYSDVKVLNVHSGDIVQISPDLFTRDAPSCQAILFGCDHQTLLDGGLSGCRGLILSLHREHAWLWVGNQENRVPGQPLELQDRMDKVVSVSSWGPNIESRIKVIKVLVMN